MELVLLVMALLFGVGFGALLLNALMAKHHDRHRSQGEHRKWITKAKSYKDSPYASPAMTRRAALAAGAVIAVAPARSLPRPQPEDERPGWQLVSPSPEVWRRKS